jgi:hypothetical protein
MLLGALLTGTAWAPKNLFTSSFASDCTFVGSGNEGDFGGSYTLHSFTADKDGTLLVGGLLNGTCQGTLPVEKPESIPLSGDAVRTPFTIDQSTCDSFFITLSGYGLNERAGVSVDLSHVSIQITGENGVTRGTLCAIAKAGPHMSATRFVALLNNVLDLPPTTP